MAAIKLSNKQKSQFYYEMAIFFESGLDLKNALMLMIEEGKNKQQKAIYNNLYQSVISGVSLASAFEKNSTFTTYETVNIRIGEESGNLATVFSGLSIFFQRKLKVKNQLIGAISYPLFILGLTIVVLVFMMNFVVPMFSDIFIRFQSELPAITQFVISTSEWFNNNFIQILFFSSVVISVGVYALRFQSTKAVVAGIQLNIPIYGVIIRDIQLSKYYQAMSLLLSSNISLIESVELSKNIISFYPLHKGLETMEDDLLKGQTFNSTLKKIKFIPNRDILLFKIGEELNQLDKIFEKLTVQYQQEIDNKTELAGKLIEPILIVFIGVIVGFILISMYLPLFELSSTF